MRAVEDTPLGFGLSPLTDVESIEIEDVWGIERWGAVVEGDRFIAKSIDKLANKRRLPDTICPADYEKFPGGHQRMCGYLNIEAITPCNPCSARDYQLSYGAHPVPRSPDGFPLDLDQGYSE